MQTNKQITFAALNGTFLTDKNWINMNSLNERINDVITLDMASNRNDYEYITNTRVKTHSIVWNALTRIANNLIYNMAGKNFYASSEQLKKWFAFYGQNYTEILKPIIAQIDAWRTGEINEIKEVA